MLGYDGGWASYRDMLELVQIEFGGDGHLLVERSVEGPTCLRRAGASATEVAFELPDTGQAADRLRQEPVAALLPRRPEILARVKRALGWYRISYLVYLRSGGLP